MSDILFVIVGVVGITVVVVGGYVLWIVIAMRSRRPHEDGFQFVWIDDDGAAREVTAAERLRLATEYRQGDSRRPYIKLKYESRDREGRRRGFLRRRQLPAEVPIAKDETAAATDEAASAKDE